MTQNDTKPEPFEWTEQRERAAVLAAEDEETDEVIASMVGVARITISRWKTIPEFKARVQEIVEQTGGILARYAIAKKAARIKALNTRWLALRAVINDRAADTSMDGVPGGKTGHIVRTGKTVVTTGKDDNGRDTSSVTHFYEVDIALDKELRDMEKQAAQELGQWVDKIAPTTPDGQRPVTVIQIIEPSDAGDSEGNTA